MKRMDGVDKATRLIKPSRRRPPFSVVCLLLWWCFDTLMVSGKLDNAKSDRGWTGNVPI